MTRNKCGVPAGVAEEASLTSKDYLASKEYMTRNECGVPAGVAEEAYKVEVLVQQRLAHVALVRYS